MEVLSQRVVLTNGVFLLSLLVSLSSAGLPLNLPFPLITFYNPNHQSHHHLEHASHVHDPHHNHADAEKFLHGYDSHHHHHPENAHGHGHDSHHHDNLHHNILDHAHVDQQGKLYIHDPDSTVKFYYKENLLGPSNRVDIHHDGCREVPMDYWYNRPKSVWAKHCITLYQSGHCKGEGVQVAGSVLELRSAGMHYGVNSFKPCEKNIRIRFLPSGDHHKHSHHYHH